MNTKVTANSTVLGRLLHEISWEGKRVRQYRQGGRGLENVLTAEALMALDFLPRRHFLAEVVRSLHGGSEPAKVALVNEIETSRFILLPGGINLVSSAKTHQKSLSVQPDGILESDSVCGLIEAKRIRSCSFMKTQLSKEYVACLREAKERSPLMILILGSPPPVLIDGHGRKSVYDGVRLHLDSMLEKTEGLHAPDAKDKVEEVVTWVTWQEIKEITRAQMASFQGAEKGSSTYSSIERLATAVIRSVEWHT